MGNVKAKESVVMETAAFTKESGRMASLTAKAG
jgi:hypothetical protein